MKPDVCFHRMLDGLRKIRCEYFNTTPSVLIFLLKNTEGWPKDASLDSFFDQLFFKIVASEYGHSNAPIYQHRYYIDGST